MRPLEKENVLRCSGKVIEALPNTTFRIVLDEGKEIIGHLAGRLRMHRIRVLPGDTVTVEMTPYDQDKGRIVYRGVQS